MRLPGPSAHPGAGGGLDSSGGAPRAALAHRGPRIAIVAAVAANGVIGRGGRLPWHLPADLRRFRSLTWGKPVVMGRRTHESIGRPLPGRLNIVVSRRPDYAAVGCRVVGALKEACELAREAAELMVIGGAALYREALPLAETIYLTEVHVELEGDVHFPSWDRSQWSEVAREDHASDPCNPYAFSFVVLRRAPPCCEAP